MQPHEAEFLDRVLGELSGPKVREAGLAAVRLCIRNEIGGGSCARRR